MTLDEEKELVKGLATSPDFFGALSEALSQITEKAVSIQQLGLWFFSQGYVSCLEYQRTKENFKPFRYEPEKKDEQTSQDSK